jgi:hypothetical protein
MKSFGNCTSPKPFERPEPISLGRTKYPFQIAMAGGSIFFFKTRPPSGRGGGRTLAAALWRNSVGKNFYNASKVVQSHRQRSHP